MSNDPDHIALEHCQKMGHANPQDMALVSAAIRTERERCARVAEGQAEFVAGDTHEKLCNHIADLIRGGH
jgi:hypothetical protein